MPRNQQILLDNRPQGEATAGNFRLVASDTPALQDGQVLVRHHYLSLDPLMRGRMNEGKSYAARQSLGQVMIGGTVGEVVREPPPGLGRRRRGGRHGWLAGIQRGRWQRARPAAQGRYQPCPLVVLPGRGGHARRDGLVWAGADHRPQSPGETLVVSAASGAVGSALCALAKDARLPRGGHCRRAGQMPLRDRRAGL